MLAQPGFQSHRLYRSINDPNVFVETAEWKDRESHQAAISGPELKDLILAIMAHGKAEPGVFEEIHHL
jgi:quinol monooxygenase YgiN